MSTGRVQGPALKLVVDKEKEIKAFIPDPYWMISFNGIVNNVAIESWHEKDKIFDKKDADSVFAKVKDAKKGVVDKIDTKQFKQAPPVPFDLTSMQIEAHKCLRIAPKRTLEIAQELYTGGYISYPRTSSQQLPESIGYKKVLEGLKKSEDYADHVKFLMKKKVLKPNNGKKDDPAHPAIYPTGTVPKLEEEKMKLYDLIARRFLATFGDEATRQTIKATIKVEDEPFITKGTTTVDAGWHILYGPYAIFKEEELPTMNEGDTVDLDNIEQHDKETAPPKRFTEASIIKDLEKRNLGTKATRASIIDTLFSRGYIDGKKIEATELGIRTSDTLVKYCPQVSDEALTRHFEEQMDLIREGKKTQETVIEEAKEIVTGLVKTFAKGEKKLGAELAAANLETRNVMTYIGKCPNCSKGELSIRRGKFGPFIACGEYPDCKTTFGIPQALVKPTKNLCETCTMPKVLVIKKRKRPQEICIDPNCKSKLDVYDDEKKKEIEDIGSGKLEKPCPKCDDGKLVARKSIYGTFLGCGNYPKCRFTEKVERDETILEKAADKEE
jgi:DNA topoisomerase-1